MDELKVNRERTVIRAQVEDRLREAISSGVLQPGARITEQELCRRLGVSRTSVREAIHRLQTEGVVTRSAHRVLTIASVGRKEAKQIYEVRKLLEAIAASEFTHQASVEEVQQLRAAVQQIRSSADSNDRGRLLAAKSHFYALLLEGSRNIVVARILTMLHNQISALHATTMAVPGRMDNSLLELEKLVDAIASRDPEAAARAATHHVACAEQTTLQLLIPEGASEADRSRDER